MAASSDDGLRQALLSPADDDNASTIAESGPTAAPTAHEAPLPPPPLPTAAAPAAEGPLLGSPSLWLSLTFGWVSRLL